jgi:hypothetical protein
MKTAPSGAVFVFVGFNVKKIAAFGSSYIGVVCGL